VSPDSRIPPPLTPYRPLLINAALTGMVGRREHVPHLPVTPEQIERDAWLCYSLGASVLHLHARESDGRPAWRAERYAELIPRIRERCPGVVVCASTSGRTFPEFERRADVLRLEGEARPDMASLTLGSLDFREGSSLNAPDTVARLAEAMLASGIRPELEVFDSGMAQVVNVLAERDLLRAPFYANVILGSHYTAPATAAELTHLVAALPEGTVWAAAGIGPYQLTMNALAVFMGGHVRTGLEDNPHLDHMTRRPATNARLVERCAALAATAGRRVASPAEAREWLGLPPIGDREWRLRPLSLPADREAVLRVLATANMHYIPSEEMHDLDVGHWYVAEAEDEIVGVAGFRLVRGTEDLAGKTTLLAVDPAFRSSGIGRELQKLRMAMMREAGAQRVVTNADRSETIAWYKRHFGYREVGEVTKLHEFGDPEVDRWTTLEAPLD
jgi:3-keto-5-aminohexanoate cleavage enzyme